MCLGSLSLYLSWRGGELGWDGERRTFPFFGPEQQNEGNDFFDCFLRPLFTAPRLLAFTDHFGEPSGCFFWSESPERETNPTVWVDEEFGWHLEALLVMTRCPSPCPSRRVEYRQHLTKFIFTKAEPAVLWLPSKPSEATDAALKAQESDLEAISPAPTSLAHSSLVVSVPPLPPPLSRISPHFSSRPADTGNASSLQGWVAEEKSKMEAAQAEIEQELTAIKAGKL